MDELERVIDEFNRQRHEEWENKTPQEKLDTLSDEPLYFRYCSMTIEELEKEKQFNIEKADKLRHSFFKDPYYSAYGCDENVKRINTILKLKKEIEQ